MSSVGHSGGAEDVGMVAAECLARISTAFQEDVSGKPTLAELVELLGWAVPSGMGTLQAPSAQTKFSVRLRGGRRVQAGLIDSRHGNRRASRVGDVGDSVVTEASDQLAELAGILARQFGRPATMAELASAIADGLRSGPGIVEDVAPEDVASVEVDQPKSFKRSSLGDVLAIPQGRGGYRLAVVLARNVWGTALGLFSETVAVPRMPTSVPANIVPYAAYTDEQQLVDGAWRLVGHDESFVASFPEPEIYHAPDPNSRHAELQGHGAAETVDGRLRAVSEEEARRVGLVDGSYRQGYLSELLQDALDGIR